MLVQDYQLSLVPRTLRELRPDIAIAHHTMVPWAAPDRFALLPENVRQDLVDGLLGADMLAFLVPRWSDAFLRCCVDLGYRVDAPSGTVEDRDGRPVAVRSFPVGVDARSLRDRASASDVRVHKKALLDLAAARRLMVRIDRMEPAKNVLRGIAAFDELLQRHVGLRHRVVHFVLAYSSRGGCGRLPRVRQGRPRGGGSRQPPVRHRVLTAGCAGHGQ
ncbi:MAG: trehalose-6-phosphate synthase [Pseudonocardiaceae bacterium]